MSWLDAWESRAREAIGLPVASPTPRRIAEPRQPKPEIQSCWVQIAPARLPDFPGAVEPAFYFVADGVVILCDESGKPTNKTHRLGPNDDPCRIAGYLKLAEYRAKEPDFNRRIHYRPLGIA